MNAAVQFVVFLVVLVALWFLLTRSTRAQQRRVAELQADIKNGDEVILSAGIFGTVREVDDERVRIEIAEGTVITVARQVVVRRVPEPGDEPGAEQAAPTDEHDPHN